MFAQYFQKILKLQKFKYYHVVHDITDFQTILNNSFAALGPVDRGAGGRGGGDHDDRVGAGVREDHGHPRVVQGQPDRQDPLPLLQQGDAGAAREELLRTQMNNNE